MRVKGYGYKADLSSMNNSAETRIWMEEIPASAVRCEGEIDENGKFWMIQKKECPDSLKGKRCEVIIIPCEEDV